MELKIVDKKEQKLLQRTQLKAELAFATAKTPSNKEVQAGLAKALSVPEDTIEVRRISTLFGHCNAVVEADVYESKEALGRIVSRPKKKAAAPAPGAAPAAKVA
jgi:ribosomal protein S24E